MSPPGTDGSIVYFAGDPTASEFVAATGFGVGDRGLELLDFAMIDNKDDFYLVRQRAPVSNPPSAVQAIRSMLLHGRMQVRFSYRDSDGKSLDSWSKRAELADRGRRCRFWRERPDFSAPADLPGAGQLQRRLPAAGGEDDESRRAARRSQPNQQSDR